MSTKMIEREAASAVDGAVVDEREIDHVRPRRAREERDLVRAARGRSLMRREVAYVQLGPARRFVGEAMNHVKDPHRVTPRGASDDRTTSSDLRASTRPTSRRGIAPSSA